MIPLFQRIDWAPPGGPFLVLEPGVHGGPDGPGITGPEGVGAVEVPGGHLDHPAVPESRRDGPLDIRRSEAVLRGQEAEARRRQPETSHPAEKIRVLGRVAAHATRKGGCQGPDGGREDMPPAVSGAPYQPFGEAAAAGWSPLPDDAGQGAFPLVFQVGQRQQSYGSAEASAQQDDPPPRDATGLHVMHDPDDIPGFLDSEGHGRNSPPLPDGIIPPPVGEDGRIQVREPFEGRAGAPAIIAESMEQEHHARRDRSAGEPP